MRIRCINSVYSMRPMDLKKKYRKPFSYRLENIKKKEITHHEATKEYGVRNKNPG